jgi:hypothetical protein
MLTFISWANSSHRHRGQRHEVDSGLARDRDNASPPHTFRIQDAKSRWLLWLEGSVIGPSLAVQQQRFGFNDSNADYLNP